MSDSAPFQTVRRVIILLILLNLVTIGIPAFSQTQPKAVMAYYEVANSSHSLHKFASYLNQIPTDTFAITGKGVISGIPPVADLVFARSKGMLTFATVSNFGKTGFVPGIAEAILNNPTNRARAIQQMLAVVQKYSYSGINVDFEAVPNTDRSAFTKFISELAQTMRPAGYLIVVSVPAEVQDNPHDSWTGAFDFAALAPNLDILQLMTYDENGPWGPPGPVAGLDWVTTCTKYAASVVHASKISLGIPAYGYDWNLTRGTGFQVYWERIPAMIAKFGAVPQWDETTSSPYFTYTAANGTSHVVWYEDTRSIPLKSALTVNYNLAGVSVFALGFEDQNFWEAISSGLNDQR
jgi:spore germination protein